MVQPPAGCAVAIAADAEAAAPPPVLSGPERAVLEALRGLVYGQVEVVVHGARIVQITRSQRLRLDGPR
jgi:hypothetical protein